MPDDHQVSNVIRACMPVRTQVEHVLAHAHPSADAPPASDVLAYAVQTMQIRYVDTRGYQHALGIGDVLGAVLDPLGALLARLRLCSKIVW